MLDDHRATDWRIYQIGDLELAMDGPYIPLYETNAGATNKAYCRYDVAITLYGENLAYICLRDIYISPNSVSGNIVDCLFKNIA